MRGRAAGRGGKPADQSKQRKTDGRQGGNSAAAKAKVLTFEIFFPRVGGGTPYRGAQYRAARGKDGLYNFVGLVLGHGGATIQRIQRSSGAKIEVRDSAGNLNGAHPSSHADPSLHAWVSAASRPRLEKAVGLLLEVLQPTNTSLHAVTVVPGNCVVLEPVIPCDWPTALDPLSAAALAAAMGGGMCHHMAVPLPAAANAWASHRLYRPHGGELDSPQGLSPARHMRAAQAAMVGAARTSSTGSSTSSEPDTEDYEAAAALDAFLGLSGGLDSPASVVPPPPPPQRRHEGREPASLPSAQPGMATVWAKGLHSLESRACMETPPTPCRAAERADLSEPELASSSGSSGGSWSLWDQGSSGAGSFYEQLQAAANDSLLCGTAAAASSMQPPAPSLLQPAAQMAAPFPGLARPTLGLPAGAAIHGFGYMPGFGGALGAPALQRQHQCSAAAFPSYPFLAAEPAMTSATERDMQHLLAAVASIATFE